MRNKKDLDLMVNILDRAEEMGIIATDRISLHMDLESANVNYSKLFLFPDFDFRHDIVGIQNNMDRSSYPGSLKNLFLPRSAN